MPNKTLVLRCIVKRLIFAALVLYTANAAAQTTGGIFGPVVNDGHNSAQYRLASNPDTNRLAQRFHYQESLNDDLMWRMVLQSRESENQLADFDFIQGELFWQLTPNGEPWQYGLRFDLRVRDDDRPALIGVHFTNQVSMSSKTSIRGIFLTSKEVGDNGRDGVFLNTRGRVNYKYSIYANVGIEMFSGYGSTSDLLGKDEQTHQLGPYGSYKFGGGWSISSSILFGLTEPTADINIRFFVGRSF